MAKCASCAAGGLSVVSHSDTNCIHLTGDGTVSIPLVATLQIDPASPSAITCGVAGLSVAGGGGGGGQVLYFTVATPGPNGFGGVGATPPTLLAAADFIGDGINDSVAIQAAIDASAALNAITGVGAVVLILPGIFTVNTSLQPKAIRTIGLNAASTFLYTATSLGAPANTRTIDGTISGSSFVDIENLQIFGSTGGAAVIKADNLQMRNCYITSDGKGADGAIIDVGLIANTSLVPSIFEYNSITGTTNPFPDPALLIRNASGGVGYSIIHNSFGADVVFTGPNQQNIEISNNDFLNASLILNAPNYTYFKIHENRLQPTGSIIATLAGGSSFYWTVMGNTVEGGQINMDTLIVSKFMNNIIQSTLFGTAYVFTNCGESTIEGNTVDFAKNSGMLLTSCSGSVIVGNRIRFFGAGTANVDDGLRITTSDDCLVQANNINSTSGRYGIFMVSGNNNMVTNNKLNSSGVTASFHDTATGTITASGNML